MRDLSGTEDPRLRFGHDPLEAIDSNGMMVTLASRNNISPKFAEVLDRAESRLETFDERH